MQNRLERLCQPRGTPCLAQLLSCVAATLIGCSDVATQLESLAGGPSLTVDLEKVRYLQPTPHVPPLDSSCGGLAVLGDVNADGLTDFAVSASRQGAGAGVDRGWIAACSGKDGAFIWQVSGKSEEEAKVEGLEHGYHLDAITVLDDLNGDGAPEIYCRDRWSHSNALIFSGDDGQRIGRYPIQRSGYMQRPLLCRDVDDDGVSDLIFWARDDEALGILALSGTDLSPVLERFDIWPEVNARWVDWLLPRYSDVDGDGALDALLRRGLQQNYTDEVYTYEFAALSGADFSILKTFETERPRVGGETHHAAAGDLNGDSVPDILMTAATGSGADNRASSIRAISGADGAVLWKVLGTQFEGGQETRLVDIKSGQTTELAPDIEFDAPVLATPDIDGDGVGDVATLAFAPGSGGSRNSVMMFSGVDGQPLEPLQLPEGQGRILDAIILLDSATQDGVPCVAVSAKRRDEYFIAVLALPEAD